MILFLFIAFTLYMIDKKTGGYINRLTFVQTLIFAIFFGVVGAVFF